MGNLALVRAVVVHGPDFLVAGTVADKINFAFRHPGNAAAEAEDDFIGEFVGDEAGGICGGSIAVLLAQHLRCSGVFYVIQPAQHCDSITSDTQVAERQHGSVGWG